MPKHVVWDRGEDFSVKRDGNERSSKAHLTENQADSALSSHTRSVCVLRVPKR
jgi:hypothetical protein